MLRSEFTQRVGFYPTNALYEAIEALYYEFDGDKDAFCKAFKANKNGLAEIAQRKADMAYCREYATQSEAIRKERAALLNKIDDLQRENCRLKNELEEEKEWKPYTPKGEISSKDYEVLKGDYSTSELSAEQAACWVAREFGFDKSRIKILTEAPTWEINRHYSLRKKAEKLDRRPLYNSTDWNYIRFEITGAYTYEAVNGDLNRI